MSDMVMTDPITGRTFRRGYRRVTVEYKGLREEIEAPGWWPDDGKDDDGILVGDDNRPFDDALAVMKRRLGEIEDTPARVSGAAE